METFAKSFKIENVNFVLNYAVNVSFRNKIKTISAASTDETDENCCKTRMQVIQQKNENNVYWLAPVISCRRLLT